jgi:hypothetical protein
VDASHDDAFLFGFDLKRPSVPFTTTRPKFLTLADDNYVFPTYALVKYRLNSPQLMSKPGPVFFFLRTSRIRLATRVPVAKLVLLAGCSKSVATYLYVSK